MLAAIGTAVPAGDVGSFISDNPQVAYAAAGAMLLLIILLLMVNRRRKADKAEAAETEQDGAAMSQEAEDKAEPEEQKRRSFRLERKAKSEVEKPQKERRSFRLRRKQFPSQPRALVGVNHVPELNGAIGQPERQVSALRGEKRGGPRRRGCDRRGGRDGREARG